MDRFAPTVIGGVSLGGQAAVGAAAAQVPCDAVLACLPAWSGRAVPGEGPHAAVAAEVASVGVAGMLARFRADTTMVPWLREVLLRDWAAHDPASLAAALTALDGGQAPTGTELADLPVPLAVVGWPDDPGHPLAGRRGLGCHRPAGDAAHHHPRRHAGRPHRHGPRRRRRADRPRDHPTLTPPPNRRAPLMHRPAVRTHLSPGPSTRA